MKTVLGHPVLAREFGPPLCTAIPDGPPKCLVTRKAARLCWDQILAFELP